MIAKVFTPFNRRPKTERRHRVNGHWVRATLDPEAARALAWFKSAGNDASPVKLCHAMVVFINVQPNDPQQRPRAAGVICKQDGRAGSAGCGG